MDLKTVLQHVLFKLSMATIISFEFEVLIVALWQFGVKNMNLLRK